MAAQISQFSTCIQRKMIKSFSEQNGGSRAMPAASDYHAARLTFQSAAEPSAD